MKKRALTPLAVLIMMLTGCAKTADILRPDPMPIIPIGVGVLTSDNVRFVGSEGDISGHRFDTAASAYASEVVRNFFKEQQALIDTHCPLKVDEPLPTTDFFLVYFPSRKERDQFVSHLPGERVIWYADVVSIVINEDVVNYSAELSLIITEACQAQTHVFPYPASVEP